ncbi:MAG: hypothetical protein ABSG91_24755, partial [Syntrophobacteraceae bacterium]
ETGLERATGNLSSAEATLEDLKAVGEIVPGMVKGAVKGVPDLNKDWQQEWATDPVGTAVGLLGLLGIGKGVKEGAAYLSSKANVTEFLTKEGIPAEQVADTFKAIEKAQDMTLQLPALNQEDRSGVVAGSGQGESGAVEQPAETSASLDKAGLQEMEKGPAKEELDFLENSEDAPKSGATFGQATTNDYRSTFLAKYPELKGKVFIHHAVEQKVLKKFPGVVSEEEIHSLENLRGIPLDINTDVHLSQIRIGWNNFYKPFIETGTAPTKAQLLQKATEIESMFGSKFMPPFGGK